MIEWIIGLIVNHEVATSSSIIVLLIVILHILDKRAITPFLKGYSEQVGQNRAMQENLNSLVIQTTALTTTTETIKANISEDVWDRQRQWEMKRDVVFEVMRILSELDNALLDLAHWRYVSSTRADLNTGANVEMNKAKERWNASITRFDSARLLVDIVVGKSLSDALSEYTEEMHSVARKVESGESTNYASLHAALKQKLDAVNISVRKELNIKNADRVVADHCSLSTGG